MGQINRFDSDSDYPSGGGGSVGGAGGAGGSGAGEASRGYNQYDDSNRFDSREPGGRGGGNFAPMQGRNNDDNKTDLYSAQAQAMQVMQDPYKPVTHSGAANALNQFNRDAAFNNSRSMGSGLLGAGPDNNRGVMSYSTSSGQQQRYDSYGGR